MYEVKAERKEAIRSCQLPEHLLQYRITLFSQHLIASSEATWTQITSPASELKKMYNERRNDTNIKSE